MLPEARGWHNSNQGQHNVARGQIILPGEAQCSLWEAYFPIPEGGGGIITLLHGRADILLVLS